MDDWDDLDDEVDVATTKTDGGLFGDHDQFHVTSEHWRGMPEFAMEDQEPWKTCVVKFRTPEDRQAFAELVGQPLRGWRAGAGIWFPAIQIGSYWGKRYRDASTNDTEETR